MTPLVSVVLPVHNGERTVTAAIISIIKQTFRDFELIVLDDGSTDSTPGLLSKFSDCRLKTVRLPNCVGVTKALNACLGLARGEYIARMDADDVAYPNRLERQLAFMNDNPEVDLVGCGMLVFDDTGVALGKRPHRAPSRRNVLRTVPLGHPTFFGRTKWFQRWQYNSMSPHCQDQILLLEAASSSVYAVIPEILLGYREERITLWKQLRYRGSYVASYPVLARSTSKVNAASIVALQCLKLACDAIAIASGLQHRLLRHRLAPLTDREHQEWSDVWTRATSHD
jgi:glycosyltransferase involved in cell wall biosynthesis